ncbi:DDHD domain-containing protein [Phycomyces nitens]|nr:DDHD domain-containing protein [Phycomyces nitens]
MFFETTYVPSPQLSAVSADDEPTECSLAPEVPLPPPETAEDPPLDAPVNHLVFVIHGIGQQTEQYGHFYENIESLQETTRQILQAKVPDHNVRIELVPIEWHKHIHDQVDPILNRITLKSIPTVRLIENDYLADVLFYFSKDRGQKIIDNVIHLFNTSYQNFLEKHPDFNGEIVILGYSLGGVIVYDILSHQRTPEPEEEEAYSKLDIVYSKLVFKPTYFFGLGSPLGAVMTFRGQCPKKYHPDHDIIFENVFHPFDPLAYRFEPLLNEYYTDQPAVLVDRSIPIGPSFSFPSMSSLPGINFLSLFSWRMPSSGSNPDPSTLVTAASVVAQEGKRSDEEAIEAARKRDNDGNGTYTEPNGIMSSVNSFLQYFAKSKGPNGDDNKGDQDPNGGIIGWDPLREQTREQLLALRDDLDKKLNDCTNDDNIHKAEDEDSSLNSTNTGSRRPSLKLRSKTFASPLDIPTCVESPTSLLSRSFISPLGSPVEDPFSGSGQSFSARSNSKRHHLVEVLGIDGVRLDTLERAKANFNKHPKHEEGDKPPKESLNTQAKEDESKKDTKDKEDEEFEHDIKINVSEYKEEPPAKKTAAECKPVNQDPSDSMKVKPKNTTEPDDKSIRSDNVWNDLNKEIHEPGPAITSPGESKGEVALDATVPKDGDASTSTSIKENAKKSEAEQAEEDLEAERQFELKKLPGARRIDHVLQPESFMSMIANEYLVGMRAHFSYWTNKDLLWHIVRRLENLDDTVLNENSPKVGPEKPKA